MLKSFHDFCLYVLIDKNTLRKYFHLIVNTENMISFPLYPRSKQYYFVSK